MLLGVVLKYFVHYSPISGQRWCKTKNKKKQQKKKNPAN